jgi:Fe2+ or Zn2+ uptake regulation protein
MEAFSSIIEQISTKTGYVIQDHMIELLGLCPDCQDVTEGLDVNEK